MENVKERIENELFYMLHDKTLDKITVTELVKKCLVSRQTFYYYFKDVYAVLESIFKREAENIMSDNRNVKSWKAGYTGLLNWSLRHRKYIKNVMQSVPREDIEHCVNRKLYSYAYAEVCRYADSVSVMDWQKDYIAEFYSLSLTAHYIRWIEKGMEGEPEHEGEKISVLLDGNIMNALQKFRLINEKSSEFNPLDM